MALYPAAMQRLIRELSKLPSIGEKSASRLAYNLIQNNRGLARTLSVALAEAVDQVRLCDSCFYFSEGQHCSICTDNSRDRSILCVVEKPSDLVSIERMGEFRGAYHVLHGLWAPMKGQGLESMKLRELMERVKLGEIREVILATSATVEGDATALFIARQLNEIGVRSSRPAQGIPKGGEFEYADDLTLSRAFSGRNTIQS
jgi:recombination protein RecR